MKKKGILHKCINPITLWLPVATVFAGTGAAAIRGEMEIMIATLMLLFSVAAQLTMNLWGSYTDLRHHRGLYLNEEVYEGSMDSDRMLYVSREGSMAMMLLALTIGVTIMAMVGTWVLIPAALTLILGWFYVAGPLPLNRTIVAPFACFILYGLVCVGTVGFMEEQHDNPDFSSMYFLIPVWVYSACTGFFMANVWLLKSFVGLQEDRTESVRSFSVVFGRPTTIVMLTLCSLAAVGVMIWFVYTQPMGSNPWLIIIPPVLAALAFAWVSINAVKNKGMGKYNPYEAGILIVLIFTVLLWIMSMAVGDSDRSELTVFDVDQIMHSLHEI